MEYKTISAIYWSPNTLFKIPRDWNINDVRVVKDVLYYKGKCRDVPKRVSVGDEYDSTIEIIDDTGDESEDDWDEDDEDDEESDNEVPEEDLIEVNIFTYTDGIQYLRGVDDGVIYEVNGEQDVVGKWNKETDTINWLDDEEILLKPS